MDGNASVGGCRSNDGDEVTCPGCCYEDLPVAWRYAFFVAQQPESQNKQMRNRSHFVDKAISKRWDKFVWASTVTRVDRATSDSLRRVFFFRVMGYRQRRYDYGNFVGGCKPILDAMKRQGVVWDDRLANCLDYYPNQFPGKDVTEEKLTEVAGTPISWTSTFSPRLGGMLICIEGIR